MTDLFSLAANEGTVGSAFFLSSIFGTVGNVLPVNGGMAGPAFLGALFKVFNTAVLSLGSLIVTYTTFASIIMTAHEGEFLGKKFHSLWIPLRTVMGIAALVPTASGYSYLQIGMMWFIIQGIGAADTIWATTLNYVVKGGTTAPSSTADSMASAGINMQVGQLFQSLVCQAAAKANSSGGFYCYDNPGKSFCTQSDSAMLAVPSAGKSYDMGPAGGVCGSLTLGTAAQNQAYQNMVVTLGGVARQFVALDNTYATFLNTTTLPPTPPPNFVQQYCSEASVSPCTKDAMSFPVPSLQNGAEDTVTKLYWKYGLEPTMGNFITTNATYYSGAIAASQTSSGNSGASKLAAAKDVIINNGWIYAGGYYYAIAEVNNKATTPPITVKGPTGNLKEAVGTHVQVLYVASGALVNAIQGGGSSSSSGTGMSEMCGTSSALSMLSPLCNSVINGWISALSSKGAVNPVVQAQMFGHMILSMLEIAFPILLLINFLVGFAAPFILGNGLATFGALVGGTLTAIAMFLMLIFLGVGVTLAVYTPLIPYMLFTFGAIGWLTATIETMIAGPLVAIGLLYPEGHEPWGNAEKAFMLILNIFLRPSLMIFGMISGMLMSYVVIDMINFAFLTVVTSITSGQSGLIEIIFFMVVYTSLFTTSIGKCFDLIHLIPDKILRWIGGGGEQFGDSSGGLDKVSGAVDKGVSKVGEGAQQASSAASSAGESTGKWAKGKDDKAAADKKEGDHQKAMLDKLDKLGG